MFPLALHFACQARLALEASVSALNALLEVLARSLLIPQSFHVLQAHTRLEGSLHALIA